MANNKGTQPKVSTTRKNNIRIIGDNVLYNNGIITAFYVIPLVNYSVASGMGVEHSVDDLTNMLINLTTNNPTLTFTIERIEKVVRAKDVKNNLLETIKMYRQEYEMPLEFTKNVRDDVQEYCILGIDIQQSDITDVEDLSLMDTAKKIFKGTVNKFSGLGNMNADPEQILKSEENIFRAISFKCVRASRELVFYNYVSKVYPCYEISYDQLSFINDSTFESIMSTVTQTVSDNFGWFEMHNEGIDVFGLEPQSTYGCMLDIQSFPQQINTANFPMDYPGLVTTVKCLKKEDARLKLKRTRAADRYERDQAIEAGAEIEQIESTQTNIDIATSAIEDLEAGNVLCQFNTSILVYAESREELRSRISAVMTSCKDRSILVTKSLTQALDFLDNYINKKPKKFVHMAALSFPLSFQQNSGANVGDDGSDIWSPSIGEDL